MRRHLSTFVPFAFALAPSICLAVNAPKKILMIHGEAEYKSHRDGEKMLEQEFISPDNDVSVIRVAAGSNKFPEGEARRFDGQISSFQFFPRL